VVKKQIYELSAAFGGVFFVFWGFVVFWCVVLWVFGDVGCEVVWQCGSVAHAAMKKVIVGNFFVA
jgi:hypothetical protein